MNLDEEKKRDQRLVEEAIAKLSEHFDSVQIFATRYESEADQGTINLGCGCGNWFARYGQVLSWIERHKEYTRIEARGEP